MGAKGVAITFVTPDEGSELTSIEMLINKEIPQREVPGFEFAPAQPRQAESERPAAPSRFQEPVFGSGDGDLAKAPPKTLGSRFRTARSRRRP
jgi:superfamily II DNA/RNA helicase